MNKVKTRIQFTAILQIAVIVVAAITYSVGSKMLTKEAIEKTDQVNAVSDYVMELLLLSHEASLQNAYRVEQQWELRIESVLSEISQFSTANQDEHVLVQRLAHQMSIVNQEMERLLTPSLAPANRDNIAFNITLRLSKVSNILANLRKHAENEITSAVTRTQWLGFLLSVTYLLVSIYQLYNVRNLPK